MTKSRARKFAELLDGSDNIKSARLSNVSSDLVDDTSPQLGGTLDTNGNPINDASGVDLQYNGTTKLSTTSSGVNVAGNIHINTNGNGITEASGEFGSVQTLGGKNGWQGYGFSSTPYVIMSNSYDVGIYDDGVNQWVIMFDDSANHAPLTRSEGGGYLKVDLRQGSAKFWNNIKQYGGNTTRDSYNQTSFTDHGTGDFTSNINNDMNNRNYSYTACGQRGNNAIEDYAIKAYRNNYNTAHNTGSLRMVTMFASSASHNDMQCNAVQICGDLA